MVHIVKTIKVISTYSILVYFVSDLLRI